MKPDKIYIDTMFLVRWFLFKFREARHSKIPHIIEFLIEHGEIGKFVSVVSVAELVHVLKYDKEFRRYNVQMSYIKTLLEELQSIIEMKVLDNEKISGDIIKYAEIHEGLIDCVHLNIAKNNNLFFLTDEKRMGKLRDFYGKIMTENKFVKQFG